MTKKIFPEMLIYQTGAICMETRVIRSGIREIGLQTTTRGDIWIYVDKKCFLRFKPVEAPDKGVR